MRGCVNVIEGCQRISGGVSRKLLTNIRSHTIGFLYYLMAILVAISIPVFTSQLEKSREAADLANIRSAYGELISAYLSEKPTGDLTATIPVTQTQSGWQSQGGGDPAYIGTDLSVAGSTGGGVSVASKTSGSYTLKIDKTGVVTCS